MRYDERIARILGFFEKPLYRGKIGARFVKVYDDKNIRPLPERESRALDRNAKFLRHCFRQPLL